MSITGTYNVRLHTPIQLAYQSQEQDFAACRFHDGKFLIEIRPAALADKDEHPYPPRMTELSFLVRNLELNSSDFSEETERAFERVVVDGTKRLLTSLRRETGQWWLDTTLSIESIRGRFMDSSGEPVSSTAGDIGAHVTPMAFEDLSWHWASAEPLDPDSWKSATKQEQLNVQLSRQHELLEDARNFAARGRYVTAILFATISAEIAIRERYVALSERTGLAARGDREPGVQMQINALEKSDPSLEGSALHRLFQLRNNLVHRAQEASLAEAKTALATVSKLLDPATKAL